MPHADIVTSSLTAGSEEEHILVVQTDLTVAGLPSILSPLAASKAALASATDGNFTKPKVPPFFTLQPHAETRAKQLSAWRSLVLDYCQHGGIAAVDVADLARSPLFRNDAIGRRLDDKGCYISKLMLHTNCKTM